MWLGRWILLPGAMVVANILGGYGVGIGTQSWTPAQRAALEADVRQFASTVAKDITAEWPLAWRKHFSNSPKFFMAVNGHMEFADSQAARKGIEDVARAFPHIQLRWGDDLRVDVLTPEFAMVAGTYHEVLTDPAGHSVKGDGFFTGVAEHRAGQWTFRNAHWSAPVPPPADR